MIAQHCQPLAIVSGASACDTHVPLLWSTQRYLQSLLERKAADSVVTAAWQDFYRVYDELIRRFVIAHGVRSADVDDCVQDVWSEVATRLVHFRRPGDRPGLRAWLYTVVRSKATDLRRRNARHCARSLDDAIEAGDEPCGNESQPADVYQRQWEKALLWTVLAELRSEVSDRNFRVLHMRLIEGRGVAEVATVLGLTSENVWYRQHRMLGKLRARLAMYTGKHFAHGADANRFGHSKHFESVARLQRV
jgi:RNA polymerase sigma factor (sigma-70 family)